MKHMDTAKKRVGWRKALALLITLVLVCGLAAPAYAEDQVEPELEQENLLTNDMPGEEVKQCTCGTTDDIHAEGCPLYVAPVETPECNCGATDGIHAEDCPLYVAPVETPECNCGATDGIHAEDCPLYVAPVETPECNCGSTDGIHAEDCPLYVAPVETPECSCGATDGNHAEDCPLYVAPECTCGSTDGTHAEDCPLYVAPTEEPAPDPAVAELYEKLVNAKTLEEFAAYTELEEYEALSEQFTEEQWIAVNAKLEELSGIVAMLLADYDVTITDTIKQDGKLTATLNPAAPAGAEVKLIWTKDGTEVERKKVTGEEYNLAEDGSWLNVAYDDGARATYRVSGITINGQPVEGTVISDATTVEYYDALQNGSFESPRNDSHQNNRLNGTNNLYWKTTDVKHGVEIVSVSYDAREFHGVVSVPDGTQAAEINAEDDAALYQDVLTTPGSTMYWSLMHMGRIASSGFNLTGLPTSNGEGQRNVDTMYVVIMSTQTAENAGDGGNEVDTYAEVQSIMAHPDRYPGVQVVPITYTWYWVKSGNNSNSTWVMHYVDANGRDTEVCRLQGSVKSDWWSGSSISISGSEKAKLTNIWQNTTGSYKVPEGQFMTRYFFVSGSTAAKDNTIGNMVDNIWFSTEVPPPAAGTASLTVQKALEGVDGMTPAQLDAVKDGLSFNVSLGSYTDTITGNDLTWNNNVGTWYKTVQVLANQSINYSAKENAPTPPDGYTVTVSSTETFSGSLGDQGRATASFTNTYTPADTTVSVKKTVDGGLGDKLKDFTFTVNVTKNSENVSYKVGSDVKTGSSTFTLRHNQNAILTVPIGSTVTVTENDYGEGKGGYSTTSTGADSSSADGRTATWTADVGDNNEIVFRNYKPASPDTGVLLDSLPYVLILAAVVLVVVLMFARKRRNRDAD